MRSGSGALSGPAISSVTESREKEVELPERQLGRSLFRLPARKDLEVVIVELDDGRIVPRAADEVELESRPEPDLGPEVPSPEE